MKKQRKVEQIRSHENEVNKRGSEIKVGPISNQLSDNEGFSKRSEFFKALKFIENNVCEDVRFRMNLTINEIDYILNKQWVRAEITHRIYEVGELKFIF